MTSAVMGALGFGSGFAAGLGVGAFVDYVGGICGSAVLSHFVDNPKRNTTKVAMIAGGTLAAAALIAALDNLGDHPLFSGLRGAAVTASVVLAAIVADARTEEDKDESLLILRNRILAGGAAAAFAGLTINPIAGLVAGVAASYAIREPKTEPALIKI